MFPVGLVFQVRAAAASNGENKGQMLTLTTLTRSAGDQESVRDIRLHHWRSHNNLIKAELNNKNIHRARHHNEF